MIYSFFILKKAFFFNFRAPVKAISIIGIGAWLHDCKTKQNPSITEVPLARVKSSRRK